MFIYRILLVLGLVNNQKTKLFVFWFKYLRFHNYSQLLVANILHRSVYVNSNIHEIIIRSCQFYDKEIVIYNNALHCRQDAI